jgi:hypothetical protein
MVERGQKKTSWFFMISGWAIAAILVVYIALGSPWTVSENVSGTLGGKRLTKTQPYPSEQEDGIFLNDPELASIYQSKPMQELLKDEDFHEAMMQYVNRFRQVMARAKDGFDEELMQQEIGRLIEDNELRGALESKDFRRLIDSERFWMHYWFQARRRRTWF